MASHRKFTSILMALAAGAVVLAPATASLGQSYYYDNNQARRDYDARYGEGAYDRYYANQNGYYANQNSYYSDRDRVRRDYDARYGEGAYDRYYGASADQAYREDRRECRNKKNGNTAAGAILGGIAGAVIGSNLAHGGGREGGAIIGGVAGAAGGSAIARGTVHCDD
jgi:hypothetical protein